MKPGEAKERMKDTIGDIVYKHPSEIVIEWLTIKRPLVDYKRMYTNIDGVIHLVLVLKDDEATCRPLSESGLAYYQNLRVNQ